MNSKYVEDKVNMFVLVLHSLSNIPFTFIFFFGNQFTFFQFTCCALVLYLLLNVCFFSIDFR